MAELGCDMGRDGKSGKRIAPEEFSLFGAFGEPESYDDLLIGVSEPGVPFVYFLLRKIAGEHPLDCHYQGEVLRWDGTSRRRIAASTLPPELLAIESIQGDGTFMWALRGNPCPSLKLPGLYESGTEGSHSITPPPLFFTGETLPGPLQRMIDLIEADFDGEERISPSRTSFTGCFRPDLGVGHDVTPTIQRWAKSSAMNRDQLLINSANRLLAYLDDIPIAR